MEWPLSWMWASTVAAVASLVGPWFVPPTKRQFSLLLLAGSLATYATYEWVLQSRAIRGPLIRVDLFWLWPLIGAGTLSCIGAALNRKRS